MIDTAEITRMRYTFAEGDLPDFVGRGLTDTEVRDLCTTCAEALSREYPKADVAVTAESRLGSRVEAWIGSEEVDPADVDLEWIVNETISPVLIRWAEGLEVQP